jgi:putative transposase
MPNYRRAVRPGGVFFITLVTEGRAPVFADAQARGLLHGAFETCRKSRPFSMEATVLLPDHLHLLIELPEGDGDFSSRLSMIKAHFTRSFLACGGAEQAQSVSRLRQRSRGVWQRRFWEHTIRDQADFNVHVDYIHYNPVKHGLVACPHLWPYSTFQRWVERRAYAKDWLCQCDGCLVKPPGFRQLGSMAME